MNRFVFPAPARVFIALAVAFLDLGLLSTARAAKKSSPLSVPVTLQLEGVGGGSQWLTLSGSFLESAPGASDGDATHTVSGGGQLVAELEAVRFQPGRSYQVQIIGTATPVALNVAPPPGFYAEIEGLVRNRYAAGYGMVVVRVLPSPSPGPTHASSDATEATGKIDWRVSLGALQNGDSAGELALIDAGFMTNWTPLFTPAALDYESTAAEVQVHRAAGGWIRQIAANETVVDIVTQAEDGAVPAGAYEIRFYHPAQKQGATPPHAFTGQAYRVYRIQQGGTATTLKLTRKSYDVPNATATGLAAARSETMTIERSGTDWPNYEWIHTPWTKDGETALAQRRVVSAGDLAARTENAAIRLPGASAVVSASRSFTVVPWGETMNAESLGSANPLTASFSYYDVSSEAGYTYLKSWSSNSGEWEAYQYYDNKADPKRSGTVRYRFRPYLDAPAAVSFTPTAGEVTYFEYAADPFGSLTRPTLVETRINGTLVGKQAIAYTEAIANGLAVVTATSQDYSSATQPLATVTRYYKEDVADTFFRKQIHSKTLPAGEKTVFAYQRGTWNGMVFTKSGSAGIGAGSASRISVIVGTSLASAGTLYQTHDGYDIDDVYLVDGQSTLTVTIRNQRAVVVRTESYVRSGGAWQQTGWIDYAYNFVGQLTGTTSSHGAVTEATYTGGLLASETDESGIAVSYTYDAMGRRATVAKASGPKTTFVYDAAGRVLTETVGATSTAEILVTARTYDDAGRLKSVTPPLLAATTYAYNVAARTKTATAPDGGTTVETRHRDGRLKQVTGTAAVPAYYSYAVESDGRQRLQVNAGAVSSPRWQKTWSDWLGRPVRSEKPGFAVTAQASAIEEQFYDAATGRLAKTTRTGYAPTLYEYDALGAVTRTGLDVDGNGLLQPAGTDQIVDTSRTIERHGDDNAWWAKTETKSYYSFDTATPVTVSVSRRRLTGHPAHRLSEEKAVDAEGNATTTVVDVNRAAQTVTTTTTRSGLVGAEVTTVVNGLATGATGHDGLSTTRLYDALARPWKVTDSRGNTTVTAYHAGSALVSSVTDAAGHVVSRLGYDGSGRTAWSQDAAGEVSYFGYNPRGQLVRQWGSASYPVEYGYDAAYGDRTSMKTFRGGSGWGAPAWPTGGTGTADTTTWAFDAASGLLWKKTDAGGKSVVFDYNVRGQVATRDWERLVATGPSVGQPVRTSYAYQAGTGNLLGQSYNDGTPGVSYTYTRTGQAESVTDVTGTWDYVYEAAKPWRQSAAGLPGFYGNRTYTMLYETAGTGGVAGRYRGFQLGGSAGSASDLEQTWSYTAAGRFGTLATKRTNGAASRTFVYGYEADAPLVNALSVDGDGAHPFAATRSYEAQRDLLVSVETKWSTASQVRYDYTHNALRQRTTRKQSGTAYADYGTSTYQRFGYNARGELTAAPAYLGTNVTQTTTPLPGRFYAYAYDTMGNRTTENRTGVPGLEETFATNALNQYTTRENHAVAVQGTVDGAGTEVAVAGGAATAGRAGSYWADEVAVGNAAGPWRGAIALYARKPKPGGGDYVKAANRTAQLAAALQHFSYDADGNLTGDGLWDYQYDAENRLIRMETAAIARSVGIPHRVLEYRYDYKGRRVQKRVLDGVSAAELSSRRYLYDGWNLIAEWTAPGGTSLGTLVRSYTWGLDLTGSLTGSGGVGALVQIADHATGKTYLPAYDGNGNVAALLNGDTGARAAVYEYDPYGKFLRHEVADAAVADQPFLFSTKFNDRETGLVYYGYRYYSPALGRFVNRDPIEEQGGINLYAFCGNNGVNAWDVLGMETARERQLRIEAGARAAMGDTWWSYIGALQSMGYRAAPPSYSGKYDNIYVTCYNFGQEYNAIADSMGIGTISDTRTGESVTAGMAAGNLSQSPDGTFTYSDAFTGVTTSFTPNSGSKTPVITYGELIVVDDNVPTTTVETKVNPVPTPGNVSGGVYGNTAPNNAASTGSALIDAKLANGIYDKNFTGADGYKMVGSPYTATNGLRAAVFSNGTDNVLVYAGTSPSSWANWKANFLQAFGFKSAQYEAGIDLAVQLSAQYDGNLRYVGHSLGGGIASAAAIVTGGSATTFNAAGVHDNTLRGFDRSNGSVTSYYSTFDVLHVLNWITPSSASVPGQRISLGAAGFHGMGSMVNALGGGGP